MKYLFDTDIITNVFKKQPSQGLIERLSKVPRDGQYISTVTIREIVYGAWKSNQPRYHIENLEKILLPAVSIVGFDSKAAYVCGSLRARLEREGIPLALADLEIASIALSRNLILVSGNTRHFSRIPELMLENWLE
ncbi:MAG: type II toxin-antitoxin system VapC family toxin [Syntrophobacteraceae bacterium]